MIFNIFGAVGLWDVAGQGQIYLLSLVLHFRSCICHIWDLMCRSSVHFPVAVFSFLYFSSWIFSWPVRVQCSSSVVTPNAIMATSQFGSATVSFGLTLVSVQTKSPAVLSLSTPSTVLCSPPISLNAVFLSYFSKLHNVDFSELFSSTIHLSLRWSSCWSFTVHHW